MQSWSQVQQTTISSTGSITTSTSFPGKLTPANSRSKTKITTACAIINHYRQILMALAKQISTTSTKVSNLCRRSTRKCSSDWDLRRSLDMLMSSVKTRIGSRRLLKRRRNGPKLMHHLRKSQMSWSQNHTTLRISRAMISRALFVTKEHAVAATQLVLFRWLRADNSSSMETPYLNSPCNFCFNVIIWTKVARADGLFSTDI